MTGSTAGALVGVAAGLSVVLALSWWRSRRPARVLERIAPFAGLPGAASAAALDPTIGLRRLAGAGARAGGDDRGLAALLHRAGRAADATAFRVERTAWVGVGAAAGLTTGALLGAAGGSVAAALALAAAGGSGGWWACDARLRSAARARGRRIEAQVPLLADLLALAVSAGASVPASLSAAARTVGGPLGEEVDLAVRRIHGGEPVDRALRSLADVVAVPTLHRLVDALLVAVDLGTPLAEIARAQAADIRSDERRRLVETAGRRDAVMLVPIVFLVLPSVVLIAVFPGLQALRLVVP